MSVSLLPAVGLASVVLSAPMTAILRTVAQSPGRYGMAQSLGRYGRGAGRRAAASTLPAVRPAAAAACPRVALVLQQHQLVQQRRQLNVRRRHRAGQRLAQLHVLGLAVPAGGAVRTRHSRARSLRASIGRAWCA
eukprot:350605-Chlamydomonas_euryale.AAC.3